MESRSRSAGSEAHRIGFLGDARRRRSCHSSALGEVDRPQSLETSVTLPAISQLFVEIFLIDCLYSTLPDGGAAHDLRVAVNDRLGLLHLSVHRSPRGLPRRSR